VSLFLDQVLFMTGRALIFMLFHPFDGFIHGSCLKVGFIGLRHQDLQSQGSGFSLSYGGARLLGKAKLLVGSGRPPIAATHRLGLWMLLSCCQMKRTH